MTYNSNIQNSSTTYQTTKPITSISPTSNSLSNNSTAGLYKGQQLEGEVMDVRNNEVAVRLKDGRVLNAKMEDTSALSIGNKVTFRVEEVSNSNLTLKIIADNANSSLDQILDKALDLAGLSKSSRNKSIVGELLKQQMPIDKNTINMLIKQSLAFKDTPSSTLVLLNKYQLPVTKENLKLFQDYEQNAHNIYNDLEDMAGSITDLFQSADIAEDLFAKESKGLLQTLFPVREGNPDRSIPTPNQLSLSKESLAELNQLLESPQGIPIKENKNLTSLLTEGTMTADQTREFLSLLKSSHMNLNILSTELEQILNQTSQASSGSPTDVLNQSEIDKLPVIDTDYMANRLTSSDQNLIDNLKTYGLPQEQLNNISNPSDLLSYITNQIDRLTSSSAKELLSSSEFKELLKDELLSKWSLTPNDFAEKEKVETHLETLSKDIKNMSAFLEQSAMTSGSKALGQASHLMDNLNFMNQLNHFLTYAQIPIKLNTGYTKSELYVYSKRKHNTENDGTVSVLLHLDMNNLGPLDVYLKLNKNQLESTFYCDNNHIMNLVSEHLDALTNTLENKGFQITTSVQARTKTVNVIKEILAEESSDGFGARYNFDVRA